MLPRDARRFDAELDEHHWLGHRMVGETMRYVAVDASGEWVALIGFAAPAVSCGPCDRYIRWSPELQLRRLRFIASTRGSSQPLNAPECRDPTKSARVRVTHPFHPFHALTRQDFEFVKPHKSWRQDRVCVFDTADKLVNLPAEWIDVVAPDPFVVISAARVPFHLAGPVELAEMVDRRRRNPADGVKETAP